MCTSCKQITKEQTFESPRAQIKRSKLHLTLQSWLGPHLITPTPPLQHSENIPPVVQETAKGLSDGLLIGEKQLRCSQPNQSVSRSASEVKGYGIWRGAYCVMSEMLSSHRLGVLRHLFKMRRKECEFIVSLTETVQMKQQNEPMTEFAICFFSLSTSSS